MIISDRAHKILLTISQGSINAGPYRFTFLSTQTDLIRKRLVKQHFRHSNTIKTLWEQ